MKARLSIYTQDKNTLFFNTLCDLTVSSGRAQISWQDKEHERGDQFILGINRKKITILRIIKSEEEGGHPEEEYFVLSIEKNEPSKGVISFDAIDIYFSTDVFRVKIGKNCVEAEMQCMLGLGEHKTDPQIVYLVAKAYKTED
jgi:hypothetical protein